MKVETIETILVCIIVSIQLYVFVRTLVRIRLLRRIIPKTASFKISKVWVPVKDLEALPPAEILRNIESYRNNGSYIPSYVFTEDSDHEESPNEFYERKYRESSVERAEVNIIESDVKTSYIFDNILYSINNYLIRNRGAASDFNLIKDIVERNTDAVEEDINLSVGVPLYLGLMGTMMGIVIALFHMPDLGVSLGTQQTGQQLDEGIAMLIGGVKIAMIASFVGLMLTTINSGGVFKGSRSYSEARKNDFYTFIQIELLPLINQGLASTLESLQRNLLKFNSEFSVNLQGLTGIFDASRKSIKEQKELLDALDKAKVSEMTRYNVAVLKQLDVSVSQFERFNGYLTNVTQFVENSQLIVNKTNELLARTDNFKNIADNVEDKLNQSQLLLNFLADHFHKLEEHKDLTNNAVAVVGHSISNTFKEMEERMQISNEAHINQLKEHKKFTSDTVADVGHAISETFRELKTHIQNSSETVKQFTVDEIEALKTAMSQSKTNLSNLEHLEILRTDVSQFKDSAASQGERLKQSIDELNNNMAKSIAVLEQIEKRDLRDKSNGLATSFKNLFKSKK